MIGQTIPSTVPETDLSRRVSELAQTGGPEHLVTLVGVALALLLLAAAAFAVREWVR